MNTKSDLVHLVQMNRGYRLQLFRKEAWKNYRQYKPPATTKEKWLPAAMPEMFKPESIVISVGVGTFPLLSELYISPSEDVPHPYRPGDESVGVVFPRVIEVNRARMRTMDLI